MEILRERVKEGNRKLNEAWMEILKLDHNSQKWADELGKWHLANEKLSTLCTELQMKGYNDCLYIVDGKKTVSCLGQGGIGCRVCPSTINYWEKELMDLPSAGGKE